MKKKMQNLCKFLFEIEYKSAESSQHRHDFTFDSYWFEIQLKLEVLSQTNDKRGQSAGCSTILSMKTENSSQVELEKIDHML